MHRPSLLLALLLGCFANVASSQTASTGSGQAYPTKAITLVVPLAVGSTADIISRLVGAELSKGLGQPVIIENRTGAGGTIAMTYVAKANPDGYTIAFISNGTHAINVGLYPKLGYDPVKDFTPITLAGEVSNIMIVHPNNPAKTALDVVAQAKAKPGELTFSSGGNGTSHHLSGVLFTSMTDIKTTHIPYKGAPQGITAVMSGEVSMGFFNTPTVIGQVRDGRLKALAVTSKTRSPIFPNVPTLDESGVKGYEVTAWFGFVGPANMPAPVLDRLYAELVKIFKDPAVREKLGAQGFELLPQITPAEFSKLIQAEVKKWVPIVKASGATVD
mgnify:CR=1 FL=1